MESSSSSSASNQTLPEDIRWRVTDEAYFSEETEEDDDRVLYRGSRTEKQIIHLQWIGIPEEELDEIMGISHRLMLVKEVAFAIELPEINKLLLEGLFNLKSFSSGDIVKWSSIKNISVDNCPNLKKFGLGNIKSVITENTENFEDTKSAHLFESWDDELSTIIEYDIDGTEKLDKIIHNIQPSHFSNLIVLRAKHCDEKLYEFMCILIKRSNKLQVINIENCNKLLYIFDVTITVDLKDEDDKYLTQIKELELTTLRNLRNIWNYSPHGIFELRNLQKVHIKDCSPLEFIFYYYGVDRLLQLKELKLEACDMLKKVIQYAGYSNKATAIKFPALSKVELKSLSRFLCFHVGHLQFPNLKTLMIEKCPQLKYFTPGSATAYRMETIYSKSFSELNELQIHGCHKLVCVICSMRLQELENLKKLSVSHCHSLETVFNIDAEILDSSLPQLDELILISLPNLTHIINREISDVCQHMQILQIKQCKSLNMLPMSLMLTKIEISDCGVLEKVVIIKKEEIRVNFFQLKDVSLENLTKFSCGFPSTSEFPSLEILKITNCPAIVTFVEEPKKVDGLLESATSNYFFPTSLSLEKLKILYIINQDIEKLWHRNCPPTSFCELENLTLSVNKKMLNVISSSMIERFNKLEKLTLHKCESLTEIFNLEDDKIIHNIQEMFPQLRKLVLSDLSKLEYIWNKEPQVSFFLKLESLYIVHCDSLKSLFSFSSAKNLGNLKLLKLYNCDKIEEVISSDINEDGKTNFSNDLLTQNKKEKFQVFSKLANKRKQKDKDASENSGKCLSIFPKIECLELKDLPNFVSFHKKNQTFNWPNLKMVRVKNIPNMKTFSGGIINTPLLRSVYVTSVKKLWLGNLKNTISYMRNSSGIH
ncbi:hypothetical protein Fmac_027093 [Flemingia macrophylla]|uniref:Disease resistance protein At4g27190-like leucine-rich repeats domain-containing protein n=1 Tax=Flemingia macrophylla TaxID=520843 RepID=A0ABD1LGR1_9FABA